MKMCFVPPVLPQAVTRPILRLHTPRIAYNNAHRGHDFDEFQDIDDEHEGLTITEPMTEAEMFQYCTGYDIL